MNFEGAKEYRAFPTGRRDKASKWLNPCKKQKKEELLACLHLASLERLVSQLLAFFSFECRLLVWRLLLFPVATGIIKNSNTRTAEGKNVAEK